MASLTEYSCQRASHCMQAGAAFYSNVIDTLRANCIEPHITLVGGRAGG